MVALVCAFQQLRSSVIKTDNLMSHNVSGGLQKKKEVDRLREDTWKSIGGGYCPSIFRQV